MATPSRNLGQQLPNSQSNQNSDKTPPPGTRLQKIKVKRWQLLRNTPPSQPKKQNNLTENSQNNNQVDGSTSSSDSIKTTPPLPPSDPTDSRPNSNLPQNNLTGDYQNKGKKPPSSPSANSTRPTSPSPQNAQNNILLLRKKRQKISSTRKKNRGKIKAAEHAKNTVLSSWIVGLAYGKDALDFILGGWDLGLVGLILTPIFILLVIALRLFMSKKWKAFKYLWGIVVIIELIPILDLLPVIGPVTNVLITVERLKTKLDQVKNE